MKEILVNLVPTKDNVPLDMMVCMHFDMSGKVLLNGVDVELATDIRGVDGDVRLHVLSARIRDTLTGEVTDLDTTVNNKPLYASVSFSEDSTRMEERLYALCKGVGGRFSLLASKL